MKRTSGIAFAYWVVYTARPGSEDESRLALALVDGVPAVASGSGLGERGASFQ